MGSIPGFFLTARPKPYPNIGHQYSQVATKICAHLNFCCGVLLNYSHLFFKYFTTKTTMVVVYEDWVYLETRPLLQVTVGCHGHEDGYSVLKF